MNITNKRRDLSFIKVFGLHLVEVISIVVVMFGYVFGIEEGVFVFVTVGELIVVQFIVEKEVLRHVELTLALVPVPSLAFFLVLSLVMVDSCLAQQDFTALTVSSEDKVFYLTVNVV